MTQTSTTTSAETGLSIGEVARISGLSVETVRYYDREGLLGDLPRTVGGRRVFGRDALGLLDVVIRLRRTEMPVQDVRRFVDLIRFGDAEKANRRALLQDHETRVQLRLDQLTADLAVIRWKIAAYRAEHPDDVPPPPAGWPGANTDLPGTETRAPFSDPIAHTHPAQEI